MKEYIVNYRLRGNKNSEVFETSLNANNLSEAKKYAKQDIETEYVIIKVRLA